MDKRCDARDCAAERIQEEKGSGRENERRYETMFIFKQEQHMFQIHCSLTEGKDLSAKKWMEYPTWTRLHLNKPLDSENQPTM